MDFLFFDCHVEFSANNVPERGCCDKIVIEREDEL